MRKVAFLIAVALSGLLIPSVVRADIMYRFDQDPYTVSAGQKLDVSVYLSEQGGSVLSSEGLFSVGLQLDHPGFSLVDWQANPAFVVDLANNLGSSQQLILVAPAVLDPTLPFDPVMPVGNEILLASFQFTAPGTGGPYTLTARDLAGAAYPGGQTVTGFGQEIDPTGATRARVNVIGLQQEEVPEPSTLALLGISLLGASALGYARRRRQSA